MPKALKSPKIAQIRWNRYFWNADTLPFPKLTDFLKKLHFFYKGPVHKGSERFCTVPFCHIKKGGMTQFDEIFILRFWPKKLFLELQLPNICDPCNLKYKILNRFLK